MNFLQNEVFVSEVCYTPLHIVNSHPWHGQKRTPVVQQNQIDADLLSSITRVLGAMGMLHKVRLLTNISIYKC
jgi:hypothetical protein